MRERERERRKRECWQRVPIPRNIWLVAKLTNHSYSASVLAVRYGVRHWCHSACPGRMAHRSEVVCASMSEQQRVCGQVWVWMEGVQKKTKTLFGFCVFQEMLDICVPSPHARSNEPRHNAADLVDKRRVVVACVGCMAWCVRCTCLPMLGTWRAASSSCHVTMSSTKIRRSHAHHTHQNTHTHAVHACIYATIDVAITRMQRTFVMLCWKASSTPPAPAERGRGWLVGLSCVCVVGKAHPGGLTRVNQSHSKNINSHPSKRCKVFTRGREKCELLRPRPRGCGVRLPRRGVPLLRLRFHMWYTVL
jgi:hypothetical protein